MRRRDAVKSEYPTVIVGIQVATSPDTWADILRDKVNYLLIETLQSISLFF
jgi:hypothetical protein